MYNNALKKLMLNSFLIVLTNFIRLAKDILFILYICLKQVKFVSVIKEILLNNSSIFGEYLLKSYKSIHQEIIKGNHK